MREVYNTVTIIKQQVDREVYNYERINNQQY